MLTDPSTCGGTLGIMGKQIELNWKKIKEKEEMEGKEGRMVGGRKKKRKERERKKRKCGKKKKAKKEKEFKKGNQKIRSLG